LKDDDDDDDDEEEEEELYKAKLRNIFNPNRVKSLRSFNICEQLDESNLCNSVNNNCKNICIVFKYR
jgi:hypothetical protein